MPRVADAAAWNWNVVWVWLGGAESRLWPTVHRASPPIWGGMRFPGFLQFACNGGGFPRHASEPCEAGFGYRSGTNRSGESMPEDVVDESMFEDVVDAFLLCQKLEMCFINEQETVSNL